MTYACIDPVHSFATIILSRWTEKENKQADAKKYRKKARRKSNRQTEKDKQAVKEIVILMSCNVQSMCIARAAVGQQKTVVVNSFYTRTRSSLEHQVI